MGIIAVVALLIFGPEKLPEMMAQAGKLVRDFRNMTAEMSSEFEKTIAEAKSVTQDIQGEVGSMTKQVSSVTKSVQNDLSGKKTTSKATTSTKRSTSSAVGKKSGTTSAAKKTTTARTTTSTAGSSSTAKSNGKATTSRSTAAPKPAAPVTASREDPTASISLFEPSAPRRERRARKATLSVFGEATPRTSVAAEATDVMERSGEPTVKVIDPDDPLARARQRRLTAGYARRIS